MYTENMKLIVFQKAHLLVKRIYSVTVSFPHFERYGLSSQMQRAAVSIPSNIAEGKARGSSREYLRFLSISRGSLEELKYQLFLTYELNYIDEEVYKELDELAQEVGKLIYYTMKKIKENQEK